MACLMSQYRNQMQFFGTSLLMVEQGGTLHLSWTNSVSVILFYYIPYIQMLNNSACYTQHVSPYYSGTMFVDAQHWMLRYKAEIQSKNCHTYGTCDLEAIAVHFSIEFLMAYTYY